VASWNVRTLLDNTNTAVSNRPRRRTALVAAELRRYQVDIAALSETRFSESGSLTEEGEQFTYYWSGRRVGLPRIHGVGFAVSNKLNRCLVEAPKVISERLMMLRLPLTRGKHVTFISAYAPTLASDDREKDAFYGALALALSQVPNEDKLVLLGDFNARVGTSAAAWDGAIGVHGVGKMNENGFRLLSICSEFELVVTNTIFKMKNKYKTTWQHPRSGHWHLLDYVIVRKRCQAEVAITRVMRGAECWTDHRLVLSKMCMSVRAPVRRGASASKKLNTAALSNRQTQARYGEAVAMRLTNFHVGDATVEEGWRDICGRVTAAAEEVLGLSRRKHRDWFDENRRDIKDLLDAKNNAHNSYLRDPTNVAARRKWQNSRAEAQRTLRLMEDAWWAERAREIQSLAEQNDMHSFYSSIKALSGPANRSLNPVKSAGGEMLRDREHILQRWADHFDVLLNAQRQFDITVLDSLPQLPVDGALDQQPTRLEVELALVSLKDNKSSGPDGVPAEILKSCGEFFVDTLTEFIQYVWNTGNVPETWKNSNIVTIYKNKGERSECGNSRGISLLSHGGKILTKIMLKRLMAHISEKILPETQCGFRPGRGTVDMLFLARQLQEKCREQNKPLYIAFVDLTKAFDTVNREMLWEILSRYGCPPKFVSVLRNFHDGMEARVVMGGSESPPFPVKMGVKQGCVIAPVLFNLYVMSVTLLMRNSLDNNIDIKLRYRLDRNLFDLGKLKSHTKCSELDILELQYADDCALVAHSEQSMQMVLNIMSQHYASFGLKVNTSKTDVLYQANGEDRNEEPVFLVEGNALNLVSHFKYLGGFLSRDCTIDYEINHRIGQANRSYGRFRSRVFENHNISLKTKIDVYKVVCLSALLYGSETWVLYRKHLKKLETFHIRSLQRMMSLTWRDRVLHSEILQRANTMSVEAMIIERQYRWSGHVIRMDASRLPRVMLYGELYDGQRHCGAPKKRFKDQLKANMRICDMNPGCLEELVVDRAEWRQCYREGVQLFEQRRTQARDERRERRRRVRAIDPNSPWSCDYCGRVCASRIGLYSHMASHTRLQR